MKETIYNYDDLLEMLDSLLREPEPFWNQFYSDRTKSVPFFQNAPDENLVSYFEGQMIHPGNVLELGCGPGRNAIYMAQKGCSVDAVDVSKESIQWATERAKEHNLQIHFIHKNIFDLPLEEGRYDMVYDSGCFHHIAPHRRISYINLVKRALKPNGYFAITCFLEGGDFGGSDMTDWEVYRTRSLQGGLGYTEKKLRTIFKDFTEIEVRKMRAIEQPNEIFGLPGFLTVIFQK